MKKIWLVTFLAIIVVGCGSPEPSSVRGKTATRDTDSPDIIEWADESLPYIEDMQGIMDSVVEVVEYSDDMDTIEDTCADASDDMQDLWYEMPEPPDRTLSALLDDAAISTMMSYDECADGDFASSSDSMEDATEGWDAATERLNVLQAKAGL